MIYLLIAFLAAGIMLFSVGTVLVVMEIAARKPRKRGSKL